MDKSMSASPDTKRVVVMYDRLAGHIGRAKESGMLENCVGLSGYANLHWNNKFTASWFTFILL